MLRNWWKCFVFKFRLSVENTFFMPFAALERPQELHRSMLSLPAFPRRFVEDSTMPQCVCSHLEVDGCGGNLSFRAGFNVMSIEAMPLDVTHLRLLRNIFDYDTFLTKCVATHLVKEMASGD